MLCSLYVIRLYLQARIYNLRPVELLSILIGMLAKKNVQDFLDIKYVLQQNCIPLC